MVKALKTVASATDSLRKLEGYKKTHYDEVAKLREDLLKESASHEEAWNGLE